jgi:hypothetical protein
VLGERKPVIRDDDNGEIIIIIIIIIIIYLHNDHYNSMEHDSHTTNGVESRALCFCSHQLNDRLF